MFSPELPSASKVQQLHQVVCQGRVPNQLEVNQIASTRGVEEHVTAPNVAVADDVALRTGWNGHVEDSLAGFKDFG